MKKTQHTPEEIKKYTDAMRKFCMPPQPLLTLDGIKKPAADIETKQPEVAQK